MKLWKRKKAYLDWQAFLVVDKATQEYKNLVRGGTY